MPRPIQRKPPQVDAAEVPGLSSLPLPGATGGTQENSPSRAPSSKDKETSRAPVSGARSPASSVNSSAGYSPASSSVLLTLTRVVGEIGEDANKQVITSREVQINDVIEQAAFGRLPGMASIRVLRGNEKGFPGDVDRVLREWVVYLEAREFESGEVAKSELQRSIRLVMDSVAGQEAWTKLEVSPQEVAETLERKIVAKRFLRLKTDSAQVPITDEEALAYYKKNRLKFGNLPFASFRENIKTFLSKQQMDRRLQDWIQVLERKYKVRNFIAG